MYTTRGRYWISLLTAGALLMTLALAGCQRKDPDASGDDINWNVGSSASVPGDVSGDTASGGEPSGDASGDTTSGDATQNGGRPVNSSGSGGGTTNGQTPNGDSSKTPTPGGDKTEPAGKPVTYYVDSVAGKDTNNGLSANAPFKSLGRVPHGDLTPGSKVLLKAGSYFKEQLGLTASGKEGAPIVYDMYGTGAKPIIDGGGKFEVINVRNVQYLEMRNLEITSKGASGNIVRGITFTSGGKKHAGGALNHIYLTNLTIHGMKAVVGRGSAGIYIENGESLNPCWYNDFRIEGCEIYDTGACGIIINSNYGKRAEITKWDLQKLPFTPATNVVIKNNIIRDLPGDGMWISTTKGAVLEYNTVYNTGDGTNTAYAGMWPHNSDGCVMQYNEVYGNRLGGGDGQGLDVDINCNDTVVQYNYSHDNEGGFVLVCTDGDNNNYNRNTVVRYNISQNDLHGLVTIKGREVTGLKVYNNTFYTDKGYSNGTIDTLLWGKNDAVFTNNIFVNNFAGGSGSYGRFVDNKDGNGASTSNGGLTMTFENNVFFGRSPAKAPTAEGNIRVAASNKIGVDPGLTNPGSGKIGRSTAGGYKLKSGSACLGAGKAIANNGGKDFFGGKVAGTPSIGAHQG